MIARILICLLLASMISASFAEEAALSVGPFTLKLSAPATWRLLPSTVPLERFEIADKELKEYFKTHKDVPIVSVIKPVAKGKGISPAVQVYLLPSEGMTPKEFLSTLTATEAKAFEDFRMVREPHETTLNTMPVAAVETSYTAVFSAGRRFATLSRKWAISRKEAVFVIVLTGAPGDLADLRADIEFLMKSIRLTGE
jgi:hypothetical protein